MKVQSLKRSASSIGWLFKRFHADFPHIEARLNIESAKRVEM